MVGIVIFGPTNNGMQFLHPEILYALLLLLIPIFIHLFQLRRFQKVPFTNVAFLKKVNMQTRKSATLKKWLTLLARMLALACVVFAFAQPVSTDKAALDQQQELVLYIDNSYSMQARGEQGPLLDRALNELFAGIQGQGQLSYFTNNSTRRDINYADFKNEVLQVPYTHQQLDPDQWMLKAKQLFSDDATTSKRLIVLSDFQQARQPPIDSSFQVLAVPFKAISSNNISLDSLYIENRTAQTISLEALASSQLALQEPVAVSLYGNGQLLAKSSAALTEGTQAKVQFELDVRQELSGHIEIADPLLDFDNRIYFALNPAETISVLGITQTQATYLTNLYKSEVFQLRLQQLESLDYGLLDGQNLIVLDGLSTIPIPLKDALLDLHQKGTGICIVPAGNIDLASYNNLLTGLGLPSLGESVEQQVKLTNIQFDHPLFEQVFEHQVSNWQYPSFQQYYNTSFGGTTVLGLEDGSPLLSGNNGSYVFSAPLQRALTNFKSSPIIVPVFLNIAKESLPLPELYYQVGRLETFALKANLGTDQVVSLADSLESFIPRQQARLNNVNIQTQELPERDGIYKALLQADTVASLAYNYPRDEGNLTYANPEDWEGVRTQESLAEMFEFLAEANSVRSFWKWFAIFALIFLLIEMLILKFYR